MNRSDRAALAVAALISSGLVLALTLRQPPARADQAAPPARLAALQPVLHGRFATSLSCAVCHSNADRAAAMRDERDRPVAPYDLWQASMKANATRDPLWRAAVSAELAVARPERRAAIEAKCLRCHAPMASETARDAGREVRLADLQGNGPLTQLALDGVSCTACHQIAPRGLGTPASFSGHYTIGREQRIFGPHDRQFAMPMWRHTGFRPEAAAHVRRSALCATCHQLHTVVPDAEGAPTAARFPEQSPYLEWRNSAFDTERPKPGPQATDCQGCHLPTVSRDGRTLRTAIARNPGGRDFPPIGDRTPYGRHLFVGGNTLVPAILRDQSAALRPTADRAAFDALIARVRDQLRHRTARVTLTGRRTTTGLTLTAQVSNIAGHKLPTGIPLRRVWLQLTVRGPDGATVFASGAHDARGRLLDAAGRVRASELAGGPIEPHPSVIRSPAQVPIYEAIAAGADGTPTFRLIPAARFLKDTRLLPRGWSADHPDAAITRPVGTDGDADFGPGGDVVGYRISVPPGTGPLTVTARLLFQPLSPRWAAELFAIDTPQVRAFARYYRAADPRPEVLDEARRVIE